MKQLVFFFSLAYFFSWIFWFPLYAPAFGIADLPVIPFHHAFGAFGPLLAAIISALVFSGKTGLINLLKRCVQPGSIIFLLIALLAPFLLAALAMAIEYFTRGTPFQFEAVLQSREFPAWSFASLFFYNLIFFGFGEETGWRGFALPRMESAMHPLMASLLLGIFWAIWHWPLFLYRPGYTEMNFAGAAGWLVSLLTGSVLLSWLFRGSRGSILVCAVFHSTIDIVFTGKTSPEFMGTLGMLVTFWGIAAVILLWKRQKSVQ